jgi:hypothetical protein
MNSTCWFLAGVIIGGSLGAILMALISGTRESRYWESKLGGK